jgi:MarR family transcriptional regulator for hemolysin
MSEMEDRFSAALHTTARAWRQALDRRIKFLGVSQASWLTIAVIARAHWPLSQSELAHQLAVEGATMVAMIDRLVKAGLVVREPSHTDRRVKHVLLTEAGAQLYGQVKSEAEAFRHELLAHVDADSLRTATLLLEQLQGIVEALP